MSASSRESRSPTSQLPVEPEAVAILCGVPAVAQAAAAMLTYEGFRYDPDAPVVVLLDVPPGFALSTIEALPLPRQRLIVVTTSPCAEYWEDLWDLHPQALLVSRLLELSTVIRRVLCGEQYRSVPAVAPRLTPTERRTL